MIVYSTNCAWCWRDADGASYCEACDRLRCEYCGRVYTRHDLHACEWCVGKVDV